MNTRFLLFLAALLLAAAVQLRANPEEEFTRANQAYGEARYQEAADAYQDLIRSGQWNATVFYDLGNAYYRLGDFGQAILNYQRAIALEPRHPEADANLRLARDEARALELRKDPVERYAGIATVKQWTIAAAVAFWIAVFLAAHLIFSAKRSTGRIALVALTLVVGVTAAFAIRILQTGGNGAALAIVTAKDVAARIATADSAQMVLALPAGSEIKVLSERGDWIYAGLPNDQHGWIPARSAERVRM